MESRTYFSQKYALVFQGTLPGALASSAIPEDLSRAPKSQNEENEALGKCEPSGSITLTLHTPLLRVFPTCFHIEPGRALRYFFPSCLETSLGCVDTSAHTVLVAPNEPYSEWHPIDCSAVFFGLWPHRCGGTEMTGLQGKGSSQCYPPPPAPSGFGSKATAIWWNCVCNL